MSVSPANLTIALTTNGACDALYIADVTEDYGWSSIPATNDIYTVTIVVTYNATGTNITYLFTVVNSVITAATLKIQTGTPADIFAELTSTAWPFTTTTPFNLFGDYGVSIPTFVDDIYTVEYTIAGELDQNPAEPFEFDTLDNEPVTCAYQCCVDKKFLGIDWGCECAAKENKDAMYGQALINNVIAAARETGDIEAGILALNKLSILCGSTTSGGCGCS